LSNSVNFILEKSPFQAGIGARLTPTPATGLASDCGLQNQKNIHQRESKKEKKKKEEKKRDWKRNT
jgi:hypothetical protein